MSQLESQELVKAHLYCIMYDILLRKNYAIYRNYIKAMEEVSFVTVDDFVARYIRISFFR